MVRSASKARLVTLSVALYVALVCAPLLIAAAPPRPAGRAFWIEFAIAIGFTALGQTAMQFVLIARFARMSRPFGIDLVMQYHRQMGVLALAGMSIHAALLVGLRPGYLWAPGSGGRLAMLTGSGSVGAVAAIVVLTLARRRVGLSYEAWRVTHLLLSVLALACAQAHVSLTGLYAAAPWKQAALVGFSATCVALVGYLRLVVPARLRRRAYEVALVKPEGGSVWTVVLAPVGHAGLRFAPGQFAWLKLGCSPWSVAEHPFSFSSSAEKTDSIEFGIKELGDFTRTIGSTAIGTRAYVDGPHGSFSIDFHEAPAGFLFVAGGIGIAPILSMLRTLADRRDPRPHVVVYACSQEDRIAFRDELDKLTKSLDLQLVLVLTHPPEGWSGPSGFVSTEILRPLASVGGRRRVALVCGPDAMMSSVEQSLLACGLSAREVHMERFQLA